MAVRPKRFRFLTEEQKRVKLQRDKDYEQSVQALSHPFYVKKHSVGVTEEEESAYRAARKQLWADEELARIGLGLYEEYDEVEEMELALIEVEQKAIELRAEIAALRG